MNRTLRLSLVACILCVPAGIATGANQSKTPAAQAANDPNTVGTFEATGFGTVAINGRQTSYGRFRGRITVRVPSGAAIVRIQGVPQKLARTSTATGTVRTFTMSTSVFRTFYVRGTDVSVQIISQPKRRMSVSTFGVARVVLRGTGTYRVNNGDAIDWPTDSQAVPVRPAMIARLLPAEKTGT